MLKRTMQTRLASTLLLPQIRLLLLGLFVFTGAAIFTAFFTPDTTYAAQSVPYQMNFQGRLNDSTGAPMPNGTYNMRFRIYSVASGGTALWTETQAVSASQGVTVTTGGLFSTQLGSVTSLPANIFNTSSPLYLEVELPTPGTATGSSPSWTEGPMSPRNPISSSPYAINSDLLDGLDSSAFAQASGSANYIQNQSASPQTASLYISGTAQVGSALTANGPVLFKNSADANGAFRIQNASGTTLLNLDTNATKLDLGVSTNINIDSVNALGVRGAWSGNANFFNVDTINQQTIITGSRSTSPSISLQRSGAAGNHYAGATYGGGKFVVGQNDGTGIYTSSDGISWTIQATPVSGNYNALGYGAGTYVAAATNGKVITSPDAVTWTAQTAPVASWSSVTYGAGTFVAVASDGSIATSTNTGVTWVIQTSPSTNPWNSVTYGGGLFVAVGDNVVATSPDGITWTTRTTPSTGWNRVAYGAGKFVAIAGSKAMYSSDGVTWTAGNSVCSGSWNGLAYGSYGFAAVSNFGTTLMTSIDGINWNCQASPLSEDYSSMAANGGTYIAVYNTGINVSLPNGGPAGLLVNGGIGADQLSVGVVGKPLSSTDKLYVAGNTNLQGNVLVKTPTNSTTAFQVQNAAGTSVLNVDTANSTITLVDTTVSAANTLGVWTARTAPNRHWMSVTYGNGKFVAVGFDDSSNGTVMTSPDGVTWTAQTAPNKEWNNVTYSNGQFVAVAENGVMTSPDGVTWTARTVPDGYWSGVTYGSGKFVAVNQNGASPYVMTSSDGVTWTAQTAPSDYWSIVTYGNGKFVAIGSSGVAMTSPDGVTWTAQTTPAGYWYGVTYGNGKFVAVGFDDSSNGTVMTSPDGVTWTAQTAPNKEWNNVTYSNGQFVAVAENGVMTSSDGITWTPQTAPDGSWASIAYGNGVLVAVNYSGSSPNVMTNTFSTGLSLGGGLQVGGNQNIAGDATVSGNVQIGGNLTANGAALFQNATDSTTAFQIQNAAGSSLLTADTKNNTISITGGVGTAWTTQDAPEGYLYSVAYGNGKFVTVGSTLGNDGVVMTSPDGVTWTAQTAPDGFWSGVTYANGKFVAVNQNGSSPNVMTSPDGVTWTTQTAPNGNWMGITYANGLFVAVGDHDAIMTSPDGVAWTARTGPNSNDTWFSVTYANGKFVAVGADYNSNHGAIMTSSDGIVWTAQTEPAQFLRSVTYGGGKFAAVGYGVAMSSPDGVTWTQTALSISDSWNSIVYASGTFVAVGGSNGRAVMTSVDGVTWTAHTASDHVWSSVTYGNGLFVAVTSQSNGISAVPPYVMTSPANPALTVSGGLKSVGTLGVSGTATISADDTSALSVQNAAGSTLLNVNTVNNTITLGAGTSLTLTGGNTASRPASPTEGMVYYDTTTHQLLTYSNGKWQTNGNTTVVVAASNSTQAQKDAADYVATGTNDQTTIANAVATLPSSGGTIYLLGGTYNFGGSLTISAANVTLTGDLSATISRGFDGTSTSNGGLVYANGNYDQISNITLSGNSGTYTNASYDSGVGINSGQNQTIQGLTIKNMAGFGIWTGGANNGSNGHYSKNTISNSGTGIFFDSIAGSIIDGNVITGSTSSSGEVGGIVNHSTANITISNNTVSGGAGVGIQAGRANVVGNNVLSNAGSGVVIGGSGGTVASNTITGNNLGILMTQQSGPSNITITGNYIANNTTQGIIYDVIGGSDTSALINNNTIASNGYDGIKLNNTPCNVNVQNNRISNNGGTGSYSGILVSGSGCNTTVITGNTITDTAGTGYAISITGGSGTYLSGNTYSGTGASSIRDNGTGTIYSNQLDANGNLINSGVGALTVGTSTVAGTLSIQGGITAAQLTSPGAPTITNGGTAGVVSYSYAVTAYDGVGETLASSNGNTTTGNATLSATNYNTITWTEISGATSYKIYRTASSGTPATTGLIGTATATAGTTMSFNDTGLTASGAVPTLNMTGSGNFASQVQIGSGTTGLRLTSSGTTRALTFGDGTGFTFNIVGSGSTLATFQDSSGAGITLQRVTTINGGNNGLTVTTGATASGAVATFKKGNAATGDMLDLQNASGLNMSLFNANGDLIIGGANSSSSANALQVQNTSGASLLTVDTSANQVTIGSGATGNSTGYLLVLDTKNSAGDPTGVSGAMYYNSNGKFRCYQGGNWQNCASGSLYAATGDSTTINGATTGVQYLTTAYAMPANYCTQGRVIHIAANGVASTAATAQPIEFRMYVGGTAISSGNWTTKPNANQTNVGWSLDFSFTCRAAPSAASAVYGQGSSIMELGSGTTKTQLMYPAANPNTTNIATNASANIQIGVVFTGTTNAANTLTAKQMYINNY